MNKLDMVFEGLREIIEALGYKYVGSELVAENDMRILRTYVDKDNGSDLDDCEKIAREANEFLSWHEAVLPDRYFLEVSSPGLERPLFSIDDYREYAGNGVLIKLKGQKKLTGVIKSVSDNEVITIIDNHGTESSLPFSDIRRGNLVFTPETGEKKIFKKIPKKKAKKK